MRISSMKTVPSISMEVEEEDANKEDEQDVQDDNDANEKNEEDEKKDAEDDGNIKTDATGGGGGGGETKLVMLQEGKYMLQTSGGEQFPCTVAATVQFEGGEEANDNQIVSVKREKDAIMSSTTNQDEDEVTSTQDQTQALPSFEILRNGEEDEEDDSRDIEDRELDEEDDDIADHEDASARAGAPANNDKVYADLDAVPSSAEVAAAAAAAAAVGYRMPYSYYGPDGATYGSIYDPPPTTAAGDAAAAAAAVAAASYSHPHDSYVSSSSNSPYLTVNAGSAPQVHPPPPPPPPTIEHPNVSGATLILPPEPNMMAGQNDNHCILIQRVPHRNRKGKGEFKTHLR